MVTAPPAPAWRSLFPYDPHWIEVAPGLRLHHIDEGAGRPVLMVHGNPTWSFMFRDVIAALRSTRRCIAWDHIGCGLSDKPQRYPYRLATHIDNAERLVDALQLTSVDVIAHDWGGAIAMGLAARRPELVQRWLLLNTAAFASTRIPRRIAVCRVPVFGSLAVRGFNAFAVGAALMATTQPGGLPADIRAGFVAPYDTWAHRIATLRFVEDIPMSPSHPSWDTLAAIERALPLQRNRPMRILWGMRDWCFTDHFLARWERECPDAEIFRFERAGHYILEDAGTAALDLITEFLRS